MSLSKLISYRVDPKRGYSIIQPFILEMRDSKVVPQWLEYSPNETPSPLEIQSVQQRSHNQTLDRYHLLPEISLGDGTITYAAVCDRTLGDKVDSVTVGKGCLWMMSK